MKYTTFIVFIAVLGIFFYFFLPPFQPSETSPVNVSFDRVPPKGMLEYKSGLFRFSLFYPGDLKFREMGVGSDTTILFENPETGKGFQIFIVPYPESEISQEQFKKDLPAGIMTDLVDILIDDLPAIMFYSRDPAIGDTREVWFVKNGFLYEVTTYRDLDAWLSSIMQTWQFLEF